MTKSIMPLLEGRRRRSNKSMRTGRGGGSGRNRKPVKLPKAFRLTAPRASANQSLGATILNRARVDIKNNTTTRISKLGGGREIHGKTRNMRNTRNRERRSGKSATTSNRKGCDIGSENVDREIKRSKRIQSRRIRRHMKRSSRVQNPQSCT